MLYRATAPRQSRRWHYITEHWCCGATKPWNNIVVSQRGKMTQCRCAMALCTWRCGAFPWHYGARFLELLALQHSNFT
ncbi:hypothetical protein PanWU01x14_365690 [Parasponia andersonii]|uniref:Uncharacterized protein n=1 Tax=Parasponia andersonii TaxID=3476 RepID=A0A2P5A5Y9_PARAD|nr:hypothetical protein PanWU01x14_365690 [Parasponia andersonii]